MAVEDLVDDFWREALTSNLTGPQAQAKWTTFIYDLQAPLQTVGSPKSPPRHLLAHQLGRASRLFFAYSADGPVPPASRMINAQSK